MQQAVYLKKKPNKTKQKKKNIAVDKMKICSVTSESWTVAPAGLMISV